MSYLAGFPVFRRSKRFDLVINIVFSIFIIVIFFAMLQIGGLTTSMGFVFIGMNCAMGSVLAGNLRWTVGMFILYCATILFIGILQPYLTTPDYITPAVNTISFVGLALWINACILFLVILFMKDKNRYEKAEAEKVRKIDEAKTLLYTNVSHEFRTPLTVIQGMAEQMEQHPDKWLQTGPGKIKVQSQVPDKYDQTPGTGLGLTLTRELVKLMKGSINVTSEVGVGTEFIIILPVTRNARVQEDNGISMVHPGTIYSTIQMTEKGKDPETYSAILSEKPILLIVEDNMDVVEYLITMLEDHYMIELASNGKTGFEKASEIIPDIILTDVMMPLMDGFELLRHLKGDIRTDHIPVVVLTARGDLQSKLTGLEIGADHYLVKPFSERELFLKLNNLLELRRKMQQKLSSMPSALYHGNTRYRYELQFMSRINSLLDEQLQNEDFGIKDICSNLNMSRPQLYRKFTALTKWSVGRYIKSYRLHKAKEKIESQGKNVTEAAYESGFKNLSHFSTSFREEFGYPPSDLL